METKKNSRKTTIFNLIILDESGSMSDVAKQTISGCNEILDTVRTANKEMGDEARSFVSIYAFQSGSMQKPSRYIVKNEKPENVRNITSQDYQPWGGTPLHDAVGSTLTELKMVAETHDDASGIISIITDGYENSSTQYSPGMVAQLVSWFKEMGWTVNLIGADVDLEMMARQFSINKENTHAFSRTQEGTRDMWDEFGASNQRRMCAIANESRMYSDREERIKARKANSKRFWDN